MRRVLPIVVGVLVAAVGGLAAIVGVALLSVFGSDGNAASGVHEVTSSAVAVVAPLGDIQDTTGPVSRLGSPVVDVRAISVDGRGGVFVGVGPTTMVDRYLAGAPIEVVSNLGLVPFRFGGRLRAGTAAPAAPGEQSFWAATAAGSMQAHLVWPVSRPGGYRLVLMRADAAPRIDVLTSFALQVPHVFAVSLALVGGGVLVFLAGALYVVVRMLTTTPTRARHAGRGSAPAPPAASDAWRSSAGVVGIPD